MKNISKIILAIIAISFIASCAQSPNVIVDIPDETYIYGFWAGTWHGMISGLAFIASLFDDSIKIYAVNNNGHWYDFGYVGGGFFLFRMVTNLFR